jgi:AcrR family transcriptional regulator
MVRSARGEGERARERLLAAGLRLFAEKGYAETSTRELAEAANVNVAAISYYFGDKAGLYRAAVVEPMGAPQHDVASFADPSLDLAQALRVFYEGFVDPLRRGENSRLCMKLHFRELLEPTGLWPDAVVLGIRPVHEALLGLLQRTLGLDRIDADLQRLAVCLAGLGVHLHIGRDVTDQLAPGLCGSAADLDRWADRLAMFGLAMVNAERDRRRTAGGVA